MLFNYFTQKLVDFEMNVLKIPTFELALSNLLLCENLHPVMPQGWVENGSRIYASKMPVRYFSNKSYLQSLLFVVCMWDIDEKSGKHQEYCKLLAFFGDMGYNNQTVHERRCPITRRNERK